MQVQRFSVAITTDASGDVTAYSQNVTGRILGIVVVAPASTGLDANADLTITAETTGEAILTITNHAGAGNTTAHYPRVPTVSTANAASLYAAGGAAVNDCIALANDRVKIVVAQGGNAKVATVYVIVG